ncbi:DNA cytosine methyltransferase [Actinomadura algeriensis]|uniref:DNA (cytosine-5-)-methyltransferase n=1 Tax=Actinomadura algeriensis TaxID=1679523 RepID=A0ABR9JQX4_9ACTN|nr:DNA (cytosine-5-)-methyltransferase [Actinomadura algeriensis]MBE1532972.1 DNA (cytosine-5)-methyltransferase 1 [Actinomadura algeriensis]
MADLEVVEICAGAGGQVLGLELAGFTHRLAIELDQNAANTLAENLEGRHGLLPDTIVKRGDVADPEVWKPSDFQGIALLAGGVPCPPFSIAGKQLGASDERDLFAWAVEQVQFMQPKALLLENVRGLSMHRFAGYRQHVLDRLRDLGYVAEWRLLHASEFGVPQLRPRFVLVATQEEFAPYFHWPKPIGTPPTVGEALTDLMAANGWEGTSAWAAQANGIAPTIVGGSKKHGGADLGPTRAKAAWAKLGVDAMGVADQAPMPGDTFEVGPKLTCEMVARIQGWQDEWNWTFTGRKTSRYRQIGNAFPPPVARAVGQSIAKALRKKGKPREREEIEPHDKIYRALREHGGFMTATQLMRKTGLDLDTHELEHRITLLGRDFEVEKQNNKTTMTYRLGEFKAFTGQEDHERHERFLQYRAQIS